MGKRKLTTMESQNPNEDICDLLNELADFERNVSRNIHKYNAYRKAAGVLAQHPTRIKNGDEAKQLSGIGDKISKKIQEFLESGKMSKVEKIRANDDNQVIKLLTRVTGIGPAHAKKLLDEGITTLEQLREHPEKLNHHQQIGLKYFEDFEKRIPRTEIKAIEKIIQKNIKILDSAYCATVCGSYRRGAVDSGDIDILLTHPEYNSESKGKVHLNKAVHKLKEVGLITDTLSLGHTKFMGVCRLNEDKKDGEPAAFRRIDIRLIPHYEYPCGILYFTGSDVFNKTMRTHAREQGFGLNEYSLRPMGSTGIPGERVPVTCERDIFDCINYPYMKPEDRNL